MTDVGQQGPEANRFLRWLRSGFTGCGFAQQMASEAKGLIWLPTIHQVDAPALDVFESILDSASESGAVVIAVLPQHRTHANVVDLALTLRDRERWSVKAQPYAHALPGCTALEISWFAPGFSATVMGFAPFGEMPVSRRAPYAALALSAGGKRNPFFDKGAPGTVNMAHAQHGLARRKHDATWKKTTADVAALFSDPQEDSAALRRVSFCLPECAETRRLIG